MAEDKKDETPKREMKVISARDLPKNKKAKK